MNTALYYYCFLISIFLIISGVLQSKTQQELLTQLIFVPVPLYFIFSFAHKLLPKKISSPTSRISKKHVAVFFFLFLVLAGISVFQILSKNTLFNLTLQSSSQPLLSPLSSRATPLPTTTIASPSAKPSTTPTRYVLISPEDENDEINIRSSASADAKILTKSKYGKRYTYISKNGGWYEIELDDKTSGFVHEHFAKLVEQQ